MGKWCVCVSVCVCVCVCVFSILQHFFWMPQSLRHKPHANMSPGKFGCSLLISVHRMPTGDVRHMRVCAQASSLLCPLQRGRTLLPRGLQTSKPIERNTALPGRYPHPGLSTSPDGLPPSPRPSLILAHLSKMEKGRQKMQSGNHFKMVM